MLIEKTLFGTVDKVQIALERLKKYEPPEGYCVCFSGGKDSVVTLDLVKRSGVKFSAHYSVMTVEPPQLLQFIREKYPEVEMIPPKKSMFDLIIKHGMPPMRKFRYCTFEMKMDKGAGKVKVDGVRAEESRRRAKRKIFENDSKNGGAFLHVIHEWKSRDVWQYIRENKIPYCALYDEGFERLGCILCPCSTPRKILQDLRTFPEIVEKYRRACIAAFDKRISAGKKYKNWKNGADMFRSWICLLLKERKKKPPTEKEISLFEEVKEL